MYSDRNIYMGCCEYETGGRGLDFVQYAHREIESLNSAHDVGSGRKLSRRSGERIWPPLLAIAAAFQADIGRSRFQTALRATLDARD